jgi:hypothetical protein
MVEEDALRREFVDDAGIVALALEVPKPSIDDRLILFRNAGGSFRLHRHIRDVIRAHCCGLRTRRLALNASRSAWDFQPTVSSTLSGGVLVLALGGNGSMIVSRVIAFMVLFPCLYGHRCRAFERSSHSAPCA